MQIENILFDLDGTLIDSVSGIQFSIESAMSSILPDRQIPNFKLSIGPPIRELLEQVLTDVHPETLDEIVRLFREIYNREGWKQSILYGDVRETLEYFYRQNIRIWIVTNKPIVPTIQILNYLEISHFFIGIFSPDSQVPHFKSKREMVKFLIHEYKMNSSTTLLVGDSEDDAIAANLNKLHFTWASYGYGKPTDNRLSAITQLPQLKTLCK